MGAVSHPAKQKRFRGALINEKLSGIMLNGNFLVFKLKLIFIHSILQYQHIQTILLEKKKIYIFS